MVPKTSNVWISPGSQIWEPTSTTAMAQSHFVHMFALKEAKTAAVVGTESSWQTTSPMSSQSPASSPRPALHPHRHSDERLQPQPPARPAEMKTYLPPLGSHYTAFENDSTLEEDQSVTNELVDAPLPGYERSSTPNSFQDTTASDRRSWTSSMAHRLGRSLSPQSTVQHFVTPQFATYHGAPPVVATPVFVPQFNHHLQYQPHPMQVDPQQTMSMNRSLEQFFPELNAPPRLNPLHMLRSVPTSHSLPLESAPGILSTSEPTSFPTAMVQTQDYQSGINQSTAGSMLGWIGRAPVIGQRTSMPSLKVDTNHLALPDRSPLPRSPSSASSAGSFSKTPRRSKVEVSFGDMHCHHCHAAFTTQGDLTHHLRSHQPYLSRNHVCQTCKKRFQYRKDLMRHLPRHDPNRPKFYCPFHGCKYNTKGFGRQDHLDRHVHTQHNRSDSPQDSRSRNNSNHT